MSKVRSDQYVDRAGLASPLFPQGVRVTGVATATSFSGDLTGNVSSSGAFRVTDTTASTNYTEGALIVSGGVGIAKSLFVNGNVSVGGTLTYEDVTNQDVIGLATFRSGAQFGAAGVGGTIRANGDTTLVGVVTAKGGFEIGAAGVGGTITSVGNAEFAGITTASKFSGPGNIPGNVTTGTYTIVAADAGKLVSATGTVTLPAATFEVGDAISVYNNTGSDMTLTCSAPTAVYLGTDGSTKTSLTLALRCICTFVCVDTASNDTFVATGGGLS